MNEKQQNLCDRLLQNSVNIIKFIRTIPRSIENDVIKHQLVKCCTSTGANYEESQAASSKADFYNKVKISLKESRETLYWLKIIRSLNIGEQSTLTELIKESEEINRILGSISKSQIRDN